MGKAYNHLNSRIHSALFFRSACILFFLIPGFLSAQMTVTVTKTNVSCYGGNNGSATAGNGGNGGLAKNATGGSVGDATASGGNASSGNMQKAGGSDAVSMTKSGSTSAGSLTKAGGADAKIGRASCRERV